MMQWKFHSSGERTLPDVEVRWTSPDNFPARLQQFRQSATGTSTHDIYARASFLKYQALVADFAVVAKNYGEWTDRRREGIECFALLEAMVPQQDETAGTLLVRSGWNGDVIVDLLVTNPRTTLQIPGVGIMLVATGCWLARESKAGLIFAETGRHSTGYWEKFLRQGNAFIRFDSPNVAFERASAILAAGKVNYVHSHDQ